MPGPCPLNSQSVENLTAFFNPAIVTDSEDRVYLFNRSEHPLIDLDKDGNYLNSWGEGVLTDTHGMFIDADENLYLPVKNNHVVLKYTRQDCPRRVSRSPWSVGASRWARIRRRPGE